ncbi:MAG: hypothetical protein WD934_06515 [Gemmatimonadales bacterium]
MPKAGWTRVVVSMAVASSVLAVVLAFQVRSLVGELRELRFRSNLPQVGDVIPETRIALLHGDSLMLAPAQGALRQVWFVFDTQCPICLASIPGWRAALDRLEPDASLQVLGVSLDSASLTGPYVELHDLRFPVALLDNRHAAIYRIPGVPLILVIDEVGRITGVRSGAFPVAVVDSLVRAVRSGVR